MRAGQKQHMHKTGRRKILTGKYGEGEKKGISEGRKRGREGREGGRERNIYEESYLKCPVN